MKKTLLAAMIALGSLSTFAQADHMTTHADSSLSTKNWEVSLNYTNASSDPVIGDSLNFDIVTMGFAYEIRNPEGHLSFIPELYVGKGLGDDHNIEVDSYVQAGLRLVLHTTEDFYVYIRPVVTKISFDYDLPGQHIDESTDWMFGGGVGIGMNIDKHTNISLGADRLSDDVDTDLINLSVRYRF